MLTSLRVGMLEQDLAVRFELSQSYVRHHVSQANSGRRGLSSAIPFYMVVLGGNMNVSPAVVNTDSINAQPPPLSFYIFSFVRINKVLIETSGSFNITLNPRGNLISFSVT